MNESTLNTIIKRLKSGIKNYPLNEWGIGIIYLFGSFAEGNETQLSDIDIGVVLLNPSIIKENSFPLFFKLYDMFTDILPEYEDKLDIVLLDRAGLDVQFSATYGKIIYCASEEFRTKYEQRIRMLYLDFRPLREEYYRNVLARIK